MKEYQSLFSRSVSEKEVERMLDEEEGHQRAEARKRENEIIKLIQEQEDDYNTSFETELIKFSDVVNTLELSIIKMDAVKVIRRYYLPADLQLFQLWLRLDWSIDEMCEKAEKPLKSTKRKIQMMLNTVRASYGLISWDEAAPTTIKSKPHRRRIAGKTAKDVVECKVYLTAEEKTMPLDKLRAYLAKKGHNVSRNTVWLAKRSGYFVDSQNNDWRSQYAKKLALEKADDAVYLSEEEKRLPAIDIAFRRRIHKKTAIKAKEQGFFLVTESNRKTAVVGKKPLSSEEVVLLDLPEKVFEIYGNKISEMKHWKELAQFFPWVKRTTAMRSVSRGYLNIVYLERSVKLKFARRLKGLNFSATPVEK